MQSLTSLPLNDSTIQDKTAMPQAPSIPKKRGWPPKSRTTRLIQNSPKVFAGFSVKHRSLNQIRSSPGTHKQQSINSTDPSVVGPSGNSSAAPSEMPHPPRQTLQDQQYTNILGWIFPRILPIYLSDI
ncbi:hypothetical protein Bca4012_026142 [Brassica carinata]